MALNLKKLRLIIRRLLFEEILVLGDSHSRVFRDKNLRKSFKRQFFTLCYVGGATASGLLKPNSQTQAYTIFQKALRETKARRVIVMLGEVDTGSVIWYRAEKYDEAVSEILDRTVDIYTQFLNEIVAGGHEVICVSTPLPTISDGVILGEVSELRRHIKASQKQRTDLTLEFNRRIAAQCRVFGLISISLDGESLGDDGLVRADLLNDNPLDHHYDREAHARLLRPHLIRVLGAK